jgi:hypothetical protein
MPGIGEIFNFKTEANEMAKDKQPRGVIHKGNVRKDLDALIRETRRDPGVKRDKSGRFKK